MSEDQPVTILCLASELKGLPFIEEAKRSGSRVLLVVKEEVAGKEWPLEIIDGFYRMPDFQSVLNTFVWQEYDLAPDHPRLFRFIEFWQKKIEGPLHSVRFVHRKQICPGEWRNVRGEFFLH